VEFHRGLPEPCDTIRYHIEIDRFVKQGETYLFFFNFKGFIRNKPLITMTNGCAGFFTDEEVRNSGGILLTEKEKAPSPLIANADIFRPVDVGTGHLSDDQVAALRKGDAAACFGPGFNGITICENLRLPGGTMNLIDRVLHMDPKGGRYGLGVIRAEADIHRDDWFLTCHFMDDMVMPGTLMYECCAHTLRIFLQQTGWITDNPNACYEPKIGVHAVLKCRGPVTPETRHVHYEVEIKEMGYDPAPYVLADAHMYADGRYIVLFKNMSLKLSNTTETDLRSFWEKCGPGATAKSTGEPRKPLFDRNNLIEFALGSPAKAFGPAYAPFEKDRFIARLPNPPYLLMDRIVRCEPDPWVLKPGGWVTAQFDVSPDHWYFSANRSDTMPCAVLMEIALQPCGWLAAYMGSALKSDKDLVFRNLDGNAVQYAEVFRTATTLSTEARLKQVSTAGDMIIESYEFRVKDGDDIIYKGDTTFGFFTAQAMGQQKGLRDANKRRYVAAGDDLNNDAVRILEKTSPLFPDDPDIAPMPPPPPSPFPPCKGPLMNQ
jgi:3-hydroxymyristoyl/3-hydroxydecanoyl-(acyl carrier protein) dehydratase